MHSICEKLNSWVKSFVEKLGLEAAVVAAAYRAMQAQATESTELALGVAKGGLGGRSV